MKRKIVIAVSVLSSLLILSCSESQIINEEVTEHTSLTRALDSGSNKFYKILPGSAEWKSFKTGVQMLEACQLEESMIRELTTEDLIEACLEFPLSYDFLASNNELSGIDFTIHNFNGLGELSKRNDSFGKMLEAYGSMSYADGDYYISDMPMNSHLTIAYWELVLSNPLFLAKATEKDLERFRKIALQKYEVKTSVSGNIQIGDVKRSLYLLSVIQKRLSNRTAEKELDEYIERYPFVSIELTEKISNNLIY